MSSTRIIAIILMIVGILSLVYGGFSYTRETHEAKIGPIDIEVKEKKEINIPAWAGAGALIIGGILFFLPSRPS